MLAGLVISYSASAEEVSANEVAGPSDATVVMKQDTAPAFTEKGADSCIRCHDEEDEYPVFDIFKTKHGRQGDKRAPFAGRQCEACHGPGDEHAQRVPVGQKQGPIISFKPNSILSVAERNDRCLVCHRGNDHIGWQGSQHEAGDVACTSCHTIHAGHDPVLAKRTQPTVCYSCHKQQRNDFFKPSSHPVRAGLMSCSECHKSHGSSTEKLLAKPTVNQTCYTCHAEKRGPFLWEHAPAVEDCTICHNAHGSVYGALLKKNTTLLCQQCHSPSGHPAVAQTGTSLIGGGNPSNAAFLLAGGCINCHSQIHGSNHPSGVRQMR